MSQVTLRWNPTSSMSLRGLQGLSVNSTLTRTHTLSHIQYRQLLRSFIFSNRINGVTVDPEPISGTLRPSQENLSLMECHFRPDTFTRLFTSRGQFSPANLPMLGNVNRNRRTWNAQLSSGMTPKPWSCESALSL